MALSDARKRQMYQYRDKKIKRVPLDMQQDSYDVLRQYLDSQEISVNGFIKTAIAEKLERDAGIHWPPVNEKLNEN